MTLITPSFEDPPRRMGANLDWGPTLDALESRPEEWAKVDGPYSRSLGTSRKQSLRRAAARRGLTVAMTVRADEAGHWVYARVMP